MKKLAKIILLTLLIFIVFMLAQNALADNVLNVKSELGSAGAITDITQLSDINKYIKNIINAILTVVGAITLLMIVYGGIILLSSHGNQELISKGKNIIVWAIIGTLITGSSYLLVNFIITAYTGGGTAPTVQLPPRPNEPADSCTTKHPSNQDNGTCLDNCTETQKEDTSAKCYTFNDDNYNWLPDASKKCCYTPVKRCPKNLICALQCANEEDKNNCIKIKICKNSDHYDIKEADFNNTGDICNPQDQNNSALCVFCIPP